MSEQGYAAGMPGSYREHPPRADVARVVACEWEQEPARPRAQRVIPDGCVDLIWLAERELVFAGADTAARVEQLPAGLRSTGVRLRPGAAGAVVGLPASELRDRQVPAEMVWGRRAARLEEAIADATPVGRLELLVDAVADRDAAPDQLVIAAARQLSLVGARVAAIAAVLGVSERTLHRRTLAAVGYGPKTLARIARLRRLVAIADQSMAAGAFEAGYASQAHMNEEVRRLTGTTPVRFLKDAVLTAA